MLEVGLRRPRRRDVISLKEQLATVAPETLIAAKFQNDRYGVFIVEGTVRLTSAGELSIAGHFLGSAEEPNSSLISVRMLDALPLRSASGKDPAAHGAVVRALFANPWHGQFFITGVVVEAPILGGKTLGSWFLFHEICQEVELLAGPEEHEAIIPNRIVSLVEVDRG